VLPRRQLVHQLQAGLVEAGAAGREAGLLQRLERHAQRGVQGAQVEQRHGRHAAAHVEAAQEVGEVGGGRLQAVEQQVQDQRGAGVGVVAVALFAAAAVAVPAGRGLRRRRRHGRQQRVVQAGGEPVLQALRHGGAAVGGRVQEEAHQGGGARRQGGPQAQGLGLEGGVVGVAHKVEEERQARAVVAQHAVQGLVGGALGGAAGGLHEARVVLEPRAQQAQRRQRRGLPRRAAGRGVPLVRQLVHARRQRGQGGAHGGPLPQQVEENLQAGGARQAPRRRGVGGQLRGRRAQGGQAERAVLEAGGHQVPALGGVVVGALQRGGQHLVAHEAREVRHGAAVVGERGAAGAPQRVEQPHKGHRLLVVLGAGLHLVELVGQVVAGDARAGAGPAAAAAAARRRHHHRRQHPLPQRGRQLGPARQGGDGGVQGGLELLGHGAAHRLEEDLPAGRRPRVRLELPHPGGHLLGGALPHDTPARKEGGKGEAGRHAWGERQRSGKKKEGERVPTTRCTVSQRNRTHSKSAAMAQRPALSVASMTWSEARPCPAAAGPSPWGGL
jgi:hypothetical protein